VIVVKKRKKKPVTTPSENSFLKTEETDFSRKVTDITEVTQITNIAKEESKIPEDEHVMKYRNRFVLAKEGSSSEDEKPAVKKESPV